MNSTTEAIFQGLMKIGNNKNHLDLDNRGDFF